MAMSTTKKILLTVVLGVIGIVLLLFILQKFSFEKETKVVQFSSQVLNAKISDDPVERSQGLSGSEPLLENEAMLFIFPESGEYPFWMKDMSYSIDIFWFNENKELVFIKENADPKNHPRSYGFGTESMYVLETHAGFASQNEVKIGDTFSFEQEI